MKRIVSWSPLALFFLAIACAEVPENVQRGGDEPKKLVREVPKKSVPEVPRVGTQPATSVGKKEVAKQAREEKTDEIGQPAAPAKVAGNKKVTVVQIRPPINEADFRKAYGHWANGPVFCAPEKRLYMYLDSCRLHWNERVGAWCPGEPDE